MYCLEVVFPAHGKSTLLEQLQHREVVRKDLGDQLLDPGVTGDRGEVTQECRADTLPLVFVNDGESHLRLSRPHDDVAGAAHDHAAGAFLHHRDQRRHG